MRVNKVVIGLLAGLLGIAVVARWSSFAIRSQGVTLHGTLRAGDAIVSGIGLEFIAQATGRSAPTVYTGAEGEYAITLKPETAYRVRLYALKFVPIGSFPLATGAADEQIDFGIADTHVRVLADPPALQKQAWQLSLFATSDGLLGRPDLSGVLRAEDFGRDIVGIPPGRWKIAVDSPPDLAGANSSDIDVRPRVRLVVKTQLSRRQLTIVPRDSEGKIVPKVTVHAGVKHHTQDQTTGEIAVARVSPGMPLIIVAKGFAPSCLLAPTTNPSTIAVTLKPADTPLRIVVGPEAPWPTGLLASASDSCLISAKFYETVPALDKNGNGGSVTVRVGEGRYEFRASRRGDQTGRDDGRTTAASTDVNQISCGDDYPIAVSRASSMVASMIR